MVCVVGIALPCFVQHEEKGALYIADWPDGADGYPSARLSGYMAQLLRTSLPVDKMEDQSNMTFTDWVAWAGLIVAFVAGLFTALQWASAYRSASSAERSAKAAEESARVPRLH